MGVILTPRFAFFGKTTANVHCTHLIQKHNKKNKNKRTAARTYARSEVKADEVFPAAFDKVNRRRQARRGVIEGKSVFGRPYDTITDGRFFVGDRVERWFGRVRSTRAI
ncbi:hypothetical protein B296_00029908 [Ensete ventricosum]|uniref:Uncharacterized protein n=1 Tax=Ensete ventricosum TaxID=4639 RepID=A0A426YRM0_ENSVE|nr:hypothetical protein B296_00029908 [Ensete ventricosum]